MNLFLSLSQLLLLNDNILKLKSFICDTMPDEVGIF